MVTVIISVCVHSSIGWQVWGSKVHSNVCMCPVEVALFDVVLTVHGALALSGMFTSSHARERELILV